MTVTGLVAWGELTGLRSGATTDFMTAWFGGRRRRGVRVNGGVHFGLGGWGSRDDVLEAVDASCMHVTKHLVSTYADCTGSD